ncbi:MAG TPA: alkaline phosphatase family protein [Streptosporangiaceae bacterium]|nr:alkaline phosphatase family protein [Streptosporangiaceae bacterium]
MRAGLTALARPAAVVAVALLGLVLAAAPAAAIPSPGRPQAAGHQAATPVKHFIFLMQGGRTFDNYFGTYPGAAGLAPGTCQPRDTGKPADGCVKPYLLSGGHLPSLGANNTIIANQYNGGKMDGFVAAYQRQGRDGATAMGHYDGQTLAFYWKVARDYVLFDHFFSSNQYGIRNNRSYWVSAAPAPGGTGRIPAAGYGDQLTIFDRLQAAGVSWKFYVQGYNRTQTYQSASPANPETQTSRVPLVDFYRFIHAPALASHIVGLDQYYKDLQAGTLPAVAYVASSSGYDERSARSVSLGQDLIRTMITQLMLSRYWASSAFMWSYDGSGGWYDGVRPPEMGSATVGFRVPALLVSAYARQGQVDHTVMDYTGALKFIEQNWRLDPLADRDARSNSIIGAFDFAASPRPPVLLHAGAVPDPLPVTHPLSHRQVTVVYLLYGGAAAVSVLLLAFAALSSARSERRRRPASAGQNAAAKEAGG